SCDNKFIIIGKIFQYLRPKRVWKSAEKAKMVNPAEFVKKAIEENEVMIFSKNGCPYCKKAKTIFEKLNKKFKAVEIDEMDECDEIQDVLGSLTPARTVPRVFVNGKFIGGGSDVESKYKSGELQKILGC
ncbi:glutaredoxin-C4-like, partial [Leptopilina heterotoma]|uniref:glutaredoxin-C4-like n=1 Tax=Leptopilina heterotoma TaxID=63436 RepID=UPI001CA8A580